MNLMCVSIALTFAIYFRRTSHSMFFFYKKLMIL